LCTRWGRGRNASGYSTPRGKRLCDTYTTRAAPATPGYWERRSRSPHTFPGSQRQREALHWGQDDTPRRGIWGKCGLTPHFARSALGTFPQNVPLARPMSPARPLLRPLKNTALGGGQSVFSSTDTPACAAPDGHDRLHWRHATRHTSSRLDPPVPELRAAAHPRDLSPVPRPRREDPRAVSWVLEARNSTAWRCLSLVLPRVP